MDLIMKHRWKKKWATPPPPASVEPLPEELHVPFVVFYLQAKDQQYQTYHEFVFYIPFLIFFTIAMLSNRGLDGGGYHLSTAIKSIASEGEWNQGTAQLLFFKKTWFDVGEAVDFYEYLRSLAAFRLFIDQNNNYVGNRLSKLIGPIRVSQLRSQTSDCPMLEKFIRGTPNPAAYNPCFKAYSVQTENKTTFHANPAVCGVDFPLAKYSGFTYYDVKEDFPFDYPGIKSTPHTYAPGYLAKYPTNTGFIFDIQPTQQLPDSLTNTTANRAAPAALQQRLDDKLECLQANNWIDTATRAFTITMFVYNPSSDLFTHVTLLVEATNTGNYIPSARYNVFQARDFTGFTALCDVITLVYVVCYIIKLPADAYRQRYRIFDFLLNMWNWIEVFNMVIFVVVYVSKFRTWGLLVPKFVPSPLEDETIQAYPAAEQQYWLNLALFERLNELSYRQYMLTGWNALNGLLCYLKVFKFLGINPHMQLLNMTVQESAAGLASLAVYLFVIMIGFSMMGIMLYGNTLDTFRDVPHAIGTLFRVALGDFDYNEWYEADRRFTPVFFFLYMFIMWLLVLNMVIGIVSAGFAAAKNKLDDAVLPMDKFLQQKTMVRTVMERFEKPLSFLGISLPPPTKGASPIQWNCICGVPLGKILEALELYRREGLRLSNSVPDYVTPAQLEDIWRFANPEQANAGPWVAQALFELFGTERESIHTGMKFFSEEAEGFEFRGPPEPPAAPVAPPRPPTRAVITVNAATGLPTLDRGGQSDPFVQVDVGAFRTRTAFHSNTAEPVWNERFELHCEDLKANTVIFSCFDWDPVGIELIGSAEVKMDTLPDGEETELVLPLHIPNTITNRGQLRVTVQVFRDDDDDDDHDDDHEVPEPVDAFKLGKDLGPISPAFTPPPSPTHSLSPWDVPDPLPLELEALPPASTALEAAEQHLRGLLDLEPFIRSYHTELASHIGHMASVFGASTGCAALQWHGQDPQGTEEEDELVAARALLPLADDWRHSFCLAHLLPAEFCESVETNFPQEVLPTRIAPDVVIWSRRLHTVILVVIVPAAERTGDEDVQLREEAYLRPLLAALRERDWVAHLHVREAATLRPDPAVRALLHALATRGREAR